MKQAQKMEMLNADMVRIGGGAVALRDDRVQRQWQVELKPFCLSKFQVTQALYASVVGNNPSSFTGDQHPVENVSWYDAIAFCNSLSVAQGLQPYYTTGENQDDVLINQDANGFRLPTDAEWQFAALGGQAQPRYGDVEDVAW